MEEMEVPTEHLHEKIKEKAEESKERWTLLASVSTAIMAVFAALGSLLAGHHSNEALIEQVKASDYWADYQAKGIKYQIAESIAFQAAATHTDMPADLKQKEDKYKTDRDGLMKQAKEAQDKTEFHLQHHVTLARSVTLFQIAIAISAIAMLTKRPPLWYFSLALTAIGVVFFVLGNL